MIKIVTIIGARPQFVKAAVLSKEFAASPQVSEIIVDTGQHYDAGLSTIFFHELGIPAPSYQLNIGSGSHGKQTGLMLHAIEEVLVKEKPNCVLVYGDTNSTLAGALAAAKLAIPVIHVEAGLRSFNAAQPEEINRILTDRLSELLITPSQIAVDNLVREGIAIEKTATVGDVMYDAVKLFGPISSKRSSILNTLKIKEKGFCLTTIHRAENTNDEASLLAIIKSLNQIAQSTDVVFPIHPRTEAAFCAYNLLPLLSKKVKVIKPVGYLDMLQLTQHANFVVTDSGGLQKEAFYLKAPCIVLRDQTEWVELVENGWNFLVAPHDSALLEDSLTKIVSIPTSWQNPYGDGNSANLIQAEINKRF
jgi:UDP-GlcNAc3NAcA epimerase